MKERRFDFEGWHSKNPKQSELLSVLMPGLVWPWVMEVFFLISGVGAWYTWYMLTSRRVSEANHERS